jgi:hypothetical protein
MAAFFVLAERLVAQMVAEGSATAASWRGNLNRGAYSRREQVVDAEGRQDQGIEGIQA